MLFYIVRHGAPDYALDVLLPEGHEQAQALTERFAATGLDEIYASPQRRARQTARPTAEMLGLPIHVEPWAEELGNESKACLPNGDRKALSLLPSSALCSPEYRRMETEDSFDRIGYFRDNGFRARYQFIAQGLDGLLGRLGYRRNPDGLYDAVEPNEKRVALFCHAGMSRVLLSHMLNIPYQFFAANLMTCFTGVTVLYFEKAPVDAITPVLFSFGDVGHLYGLGRPLRNSKDGVSF